MILVLPAATRGQWDREQGGEMLRHYDHRQRDVELVMDSLSGDPQQLRVLDDFGRELRQDVARGICGGRCVIGAVRHLQRDVGMARTPIGDWIDQRDATDTGYVEAPCGRTGRYFRRDAATTGEWPRERLPGKAACLGYLTTLAATALDDLASSVLDGRSNSPPRGLCSTAGTVFGCRLVLMP